jgi:hypothetical protein
MADLTLEKKIYLDGAKSGGPDASLDGLSSSPPSTPYAFVAGDTYPLKVYFRARADDNGASTALNPVAGSTLVVAGKLAASGGGLLFSSSLTVSGDFFTGTLDLNTAEVVAALATTAHGGYIDVFVDFEVKNAGGTVVLTYRANCLLYQQVYAGETAPSSVVPPTPILLSPDGSRWEIAATDDGQLSLTKVA